MHYAAWRYCTDVMETVWPEGTPSGLRVLELGSRRPRQPLTTYDEVILIDSPLVYWRFDEVGTTFLDSSGNGNDGDASAAFEAEFPPQRGALSLVNNSNDALGGPGDTNEFEEWVAPSPFPCGLPDLSSSITVEAWVSFPPGDPGEHSWNICARDDQDFAIQWLFELRSNGPQISLRNDEGDDGLLLDDSPYDLTITPQHHILWTYNGDTGIMSIWVDGLRNGQATSFVGSLMPMSDPALSFTVHGSPVLDEFAIYDYELSEEQILAHYAAASLYREWVDTIVGDDPAIFWRLNELSGTTFFDWSGNGNDGDASDLMEKIYPPAFGATSLVATDPGNTALSGPTADGVEVNGYIQNVDSVCLPDKASSLSLEFWFTRDPEPIGNLSIQMVRVADPNEVQWQISLLDNGSGSALLLGPTSLDVGIYLEFDAPLTLTPQHLALVYDGATETLTVYLDGESIATDTGFAGASILTFGDPQLTLNLCHGDVIDEIAIYDHALEAEQIVLHHESGLTSLAPDYPARDLFPFPSFYLGLSPIAGDGVDLVIDPADFVVGASATYGASATAHSYDVVVSTEYLEHTPRLTEVMTVASQALLDDGFLLITCAMEPRSPHSYLDNGELGEDEFYANVNPDTLWGILHTLGFDPISKTTQPAAGNLFINTFAPPPPPEETPPSDEVLATLATLVGQVDSLTDGLATLEAIAVTGEWAED